MEISEDILVILEAAAKSLIESHCDQVVDLCIDETKKIIPGEIDDLILDQLKKSFEEKIKEFLLSQAEKISPK